MQSNLFDRTPVDGYFYCFHSFLKGPPFFTLSAAANNFKNNILAKCEYISWIHSQSGMHICNFDKYCKIALQSELHQFLPLYTMLTSPYSLPIQHIIGMDLCQFISRTWCVSIILVVFILTNNEVGYLFLWLKDVFLSFSLICVFYPVFHFAFELLVFLSICRNFYISEKLPLCLWYEF